MPQPQPLGIGRGKTVLVFGVPGAGKTRFIVGKCPKCLIIRPPTDMTDSIEAGSDCEEIVIEDWQDMFETFAWGQQGGFKSYDWVWLDSISQAQDVLLEDVLTNMLIRRPDLAMDKAGNDPTRQGWVELKKSGIVVPEFGADKGDYKTNFDRITKWVRDMTGLAKAGMFNFGITAHTEKVWDPILQEEVWAPWIQGKNMINKICGYMNVVAYLQEQKGDGAKRVLMVDQQGIMGHDRLHVFPELKSGRHGIIEPTGEKLSKVLRGAAAKSEASAAAPKRKREVKPRKVRRRKS